MAVFRENSAARFGQCFNRIKMEADSSLYKEYLEWPIYDLAPEFYYDLWNILEMDDGWKELLRVFLSLNSNRSLNLSESHITHISKRRPEESSAKIMLDELSSICFPIGQLIKCLEIIDPDHQALSLLKADEALSIIKKLPDLLSLKSGGTLNLECLAHGFPSPKYLWHKNEQEFPNGNAPKLQISKLRVSDAGVYVCAVYQFDRDTGEIMKPILYSNKCLVTIQHNLSDIAEINNFYDSPEENTVSDALTKNCNKSLHSAEDKYALLIGNQDYDSLKKLNLPAADVKTMDTILTHKGFKVMALQNLTLTEMKNAIHLFSRQLTKNSYVVFYFVGHGFEDGDCYMMPTESGLDYLKEDSLALDDLSNAILHAQPGLALFFLDICRKKPSERVPEKMKRARSIPMRDNVLLAYATSPMCSASELTNGTNGIYMSHLKKFLPEKRPIWDILLDVNKDMENLNQRPWNAGNLSRDIALDDPIVSKNPWTSDLWNTLRGCPCPVLSKVSRINLQICVHCNPHLQVFSNSMDIHIEITQLEWISETCGFIPDQLKSNSIHIPVEIQEQTSQTISATISNLQRLKGNLSLELLLKPTTSVEFPTIVHLKFGKPMIAKQDIWINPLQT